MLVCENKNSILIGHQCGFHLPQNLGQGKFAKIFDVLETLNSAAEITKLLQETTQRSYELPNLVIAYHYLTDVTLQKIIEQASMDQFTLRFTHIDYMNDTMDGKYGHNEFFMAVKYILEDERNDSELFQVLQKDLNHEFSKLLTKSPCTRNNKVGTLFKVNGELCEAYVCSLSLDPESISLWRSYGSGFSESYAIGIETKKLTNISVCRIEYKDFEKERRSLPNMIILKIIDLCKKGIISISDVSDIIKAVIEFSSAWSISHKDYYWAHEKEIRFVKFVPSGREPDGYAVRNGVFCPYIEEQFDKKCVKEVIVGPMIERYNAAKSIDEFMGSKGFGGGCEKLQVRCSVLPVRF